MHYSYFSTVTTHFFIELENLTIRKHFCTVSHLFAENLHFQGTRKTQGFCCPFYPYKDPLLERVLY